MHDCILMNMEKEWAVNLVLQDWHHRSKCIVNNVHSIVKTKCGSKIVIIA